MLLRRTPCQLRVEGCYCLSVTGMSSSHMSFQQCHATSNHLDGDYDTADSANERVPGFDGLIHGTDAVRNIADCARLGPWRSGVELLERRRGGLINGISQLRARPEHFPTHILRITWPLGVLLAGSSSTGSCSGLPNSPCPRGPTSALSGPSRRGRPAGSVVSGWGRASSAPGSPVCSRPYRGSTWTWPLLSVRTLEIMGLPGTSGFIRLVSSGSCSEVSSGPFLPWSPSCSPGGSGSPALWSVSSGGATRRRCCPARPFRCRVRLRRSSCRAGWARPPGGGRSVAGGSVNGGAGGGLGGLLRGLADLGRFGCLGRLGCLGRGRVAVVGGPVRRLRIRPGLPHGLGVPAGRLRGAVHAVRRGRRGAGGPVAGLGGRFGPGPAVALRVRTQPVRPRLSAPGGVCSAPVGVPLSAGAAALSWRGAAGAPGPAGVRPRARGRRPARRTAGRRAGHSPGAPPLAARVSPGGVSGGRPSWRTPSPPAASRAPCPSACASRPVPSVSVCPAYRALSAWFPSCGAVGPPSRVSPGWLPLPPPVPSAFCAARCCWPRGRGRDRPAGTAGRAAQDFRLASCTAPPTRTGRRARRGRRSPPGRLALGMVAFVGARCLGGFGFGTVRCGSGLAGLRFLIGFRVGFGRWVAGAALLVAGRTGSGRLAGPLVALVGAGLPVALEFPVYAAEAVGAGRFAGRSVVLGRWLVAVALRGGLVDGFGPLPGPLGWSTPTLAVLPPGEANREGIERTVRRACLLTRGADVTSTSDPYVIAHARTLHVPIFPPPRSACVSPPSALPARPVHTPGPVSRNDPVPGEQPIKRYGNTQFNPNNRFGPVATRWPTRWPASTGRSGPAPMPLRVKGSSPRKSPYPATESCVIGHVTDRGGCQPVLAAPTWTGNMRIFTGVVLLLLAAVAVAVRWQLFSRGILYGDAAARWPA